MTKTTIYRIGAAQFIRLPEALVFPAGVEQVEIARNGETLTITPSSRPWDDFFDAPGVSSDFLTRRTQDPRST